METSAISVVSSPRMTVSQMGRGRRLDVEEFERRRRTMGRILSYLGEHGITQRHMQRRVSDRLGERLGDPRWQGIRKGYCRIPEGFVQAVCAELEKPVEAVMGREWVRVDGPYFGFGPVVERVPAA